VATTDGGTPSVPASIEAAWGVRTRPGRGPKPGLSLDRIVDAAVKIALSNGLAAVSMNRVAGDLGTSAMSLYRYVAAKDELLDLMVDAAFGTPPQAQPGEDWRAAMSRWAWASLQAFRRHPWSVRVPIKGPPITPNQIVWLENGLAAMRDTGLTAQEKMSVILLVSGFVRNWATLTTDLAAAGLAGTDPEPPVGYGRTLARLIDPLRFPEVHAVIGSGTLDDEEDEFDNEFVFGLERLLDGVGALVASRRDAGPRSRR
jgi:AcrR family transcriptional regulator